MTGIKINLNAIKSSGLSNNGESINDIVPKNDNKITEEIISLGNNGDLAISEDKKDTIILSGLKSLDSISAGDENLDIEIKEKKKDFGILNNKQEKEETIEKKIENDILLSESEIKKDKEIMEIIEGNKISENIENKEKKENIIGTKINLTKIKEVKIDENGNGDKREIEIDGLTLIKEEEKKEIFSAYKSDFIKKQESIFEKLKKIKNLPKTRFGLLAILIFFVISVISGLFYLDPEHHNLQNYKTSILNIVGIKDEDTIIIKENTKDNNKQILDNIVKNNTGNFVGNEYEIKISEGVEKFMYSGELYNSEEDVIKAIKREKINKFLNK